MCLLKMLIGEKKMSNGKAADTTLMTSELLKWTRA